jgi:hypothetical protein
MPYLQFHNHLAMLTSGLQGLLSSEEEMTRKLELDRERDSVVHLAQAKADCEGIISLIFCVFP